jgi:OOP family OmpA-OmpF porin
MSSHRNVKVFFLVLMGVFLLSSCATHQMPPFQAQQVDTSGYVQRFDNFMVLFDASQSMSYPWFSDKKRLYVGKDVARRLNETIPVLPMNAGLLAFGHATCDRHDGMPLLYELSNYNKGEFSNALHRIECANGKTPISGAINTASGLVRQVKGAHGIIIISDGIREYMDSDPVEAAMNMKKRYGDHVCIFTIHVGDDSDGKEILKNVADASECGFAVNAGAIMSSAAMADYVEKVFLAIDSDGDGVPDERDDCPDTPRGLKVDERGCHLDSDGDGVPDHLDKCPNTPPGVKVDAHGCPLDSDGDGVPDYLDECPGTPLGTKVDEKGCPIKKEKFIIQFDLDSDVIRPDAQVILDLAAALLQEDPAMKVRIEGHTCDLGTAQYNYGLSVRRAEATKSYLITRGIDSYRMITVGKGENYPIVPNYDEQHRRQNRRAEFVVIDVIK